MTIPERVAALTRGKRGLHKLREHLATTRAHLGTARTALNNIYSLADEADVWDATHRIEAIVSEVYATLLRYRALGSMRWEPQPDTARFRHPRASVQSNGAHPANSWDGHHWFLPDGC